MTKRNIFKRDKKRLAAFRARFLVFLKNADGWFDLCNALNMPLPPDIRHLMIQGRDTAVRHQALLEKELRAYAAATAYRPGAKLLLAEINVQEGPNVA